MSDHAEEMWLVAHLSMLSTDGAFDEVDRVLDGLTPEQEASLLRTVLDSVGLMARDVTGPHTGMTSVVEWLQRSRDTWAQEVLSDVWRRSAPRE